MPFYLLVKGHAIMTAGTMMMMTMGTPKNRTIIPPASKTLKTDFHRTYKKNYNKSTRMKKNNRNQPEKTLNTYAKDVKRLRSGSNTCGASPYNSLLT